ncbi:MAG TPA: radical SAM protein [Deltaproteobacteria bacterium]|nr:radical SAM protein [Deltaproteobacteria bacterium]
MTTIMKTDKAKSFLLINPWITDFAAYDFWSRPLGLLYLASLLRAAGHGVSIINCLDYTLDASSVPKSARPVRRKYGTGKFIRMEINKPEALRDIRRKFCRYGMLAETFRKKLTEMPAPDVILITSIMTYWYPGIVQTIETVREIFPDAVIVLGGTYVRLCYEHALSIPGIDYLYRGKLDSFPAFLEGKLNVPIKNCSQWKDFAHYPFPAFELWEPKPLNAVAIMTSEGCPFSCPYCASSVLHPRFIRRSPESVFEEILYWHKNYGVEDFAFYDDALLVDSENHIVPILKKVKEAGLNVRFHTPNAVHVRELHGKLCELLKISGFTTLRLGLETVTTQRIVQRDNKIEKGQFPWAMENLRKAGFLPSQIGVYLLCGLPFQDPSEVEYSIEVVKEHGGSPYLAEYSPIPHTKMWEEAVKASPFPIETEPLFHNNTLFPCQCERFPVSELERLKRKAREARVAVSNTQLLHHST